MGYTHYFNHSRTSLVVWDKILKDCRKLYKNMPERSTSSGGFYKDEPLLIDGDWFYNTIKRGPYEGQVTTRPQARFTINHIFFNGCDEHHNNGRLGHETFVLERAGRNRFAFCKTARKPYDLMVQACLLVYQYHSPETIDLGSDGEGRDWMQAVKFVNKTLGYKIKNPFRR